MGNLQCGLSMLPTEGAYILTAALLQIKSQRSVIH